MLSKLKLVRLPKFSLHDLLVVGLPALLLLLLGFWLAAQYIRPALPDKLIITAGETGDAYDRTAQRYKEILAPYGVDVVVLPSQGAMENLARLRDEDFEVDAGFVHSGTAQASDEDSLASLGSLFQEPVWVFYREGLAKSELTQISQLKGKRIAIGRPASSTRSLATDLLAANGISAANAEFHDDHGLELGKSLQNGKLDAAFVVGPVDAPLVWMLLYTKGVKLMSIAQAAAYTYHFPNLTHLTLLRGSLDLANDVPARDVSLIATRANLVVTDDLHPALVDLLLQAASEVHGGPGTLQRPGEFPKDVSGDFPLAEEAARYFKSGKPFLQRYLPFWAATLIDRMVVMFIPLFALLIPVLRFAPALYNWRIGSRIYKRYGELKFLESALEAMPSRHTQAQWLAQLDRIEADVNNLVTPLAFAEKLYTLRSHIGLVREAVLHRVPN